jgi:hypothetical protein
MSLSVYPLSSPVNGSVNTFPQQRILGGVFYAVRVVSIESRQLVVQKIFYSTFILFPFAIIAIAITLTATRV